MTSGSHAAKVWGLRQPGGLCPGSALASSDIHNQLERKVPLLRGCTCKNSAVLSSRSREHLIQKVSSKKSLLEQQRGEVVQRGAVSASSAGTNSCGCLPVEVKEALPLLQMQEPLVLLHGNSQLPKIQLRADDKGQPGSSEMQDQNSRLGTFLRVPSNRSPSKSYSH